MLELSHRHVPDPGRHLHPLVRLLRDQDRAAQQLDWDEPERVARSVETLQLQHVVITSVNRDNLLLGGADIYAETIRLIKEYVPNCTIEVLTPDFKGYWPALEMVVAAGPRILNHNVESVPRLYYCVRPQAKYARSLEFLAGAKRWTRPARCGPNRA